MLFSLKYFLIQKLPFGLKINRFMCFNLCFLLIKHRWSLLRPPVVIFWDFQNINL